MCTAIAQPKGTPTLTIKTLEKGWSANPDGGGYAFIDHNNELVMRHFMDEDDFILNYLQDHEDHGANTPFIIHVRIATHGSVTLENCHPFDVPMQGDGDMAMIHNGIISKMDPYIKGTDDTDTEGLIQYVLCDLVDGWLDSELMVELMEDAIDSSKLVFLSTSPDLDSQMYILNESLGVWDDEVWFSNYSCFTYSPTKTVYGTDYTYGQDNDGWWDGSQSIYSSYKNGVYQEGNKPSEDQLDTRSIDDFGTWLIDPEDRRCTASQLANATVSEHVAMFNNSLVHEDACSICTGIKRCLCDDICAACYEAYHECECMGNFTSLEDSFSDGWVERVTAIAESALTAKEADEMEAPF